MSFQLSLLPDPDPVVVDHRAVEALHVAVARARHTTHDVARSRSHRARALRDWTGPLRDRHDEEEGALADVGEEVDLALAHLDRMLTREVERLRVLRDRRAALPW